jgi:hypothetical protein
MRVQVRASRKGRVQVNENILDLRLGFRALFKTSNETNCDDTKKGERSTEGKKRCEGATSEALTVNIVGLAFHKTAPEFATPRNWTKDGRMDGYTSWGAGEPIERKDNYHNIDLCQQRISVETEAKCEAFNDDKNSTTRTKGVR